MCASRDCNMRTLFISHIVPYPLNGGTRQRVFHLLRALSRISEVTLVCPTSHAERTDDVAALQSLCTETFSYPSRPYGPQWRNSVLRWIEWKLRYLYFPRPVDLQFTRSRAGANLIRQLRPERYDLVWVERLEAMQLLPTRLNTRVVVDLDDIQTEWLAARLRHEPPSRGKFFEFLEYLKWRQTENGLRKFPYTVAVCSEAGRELLKCGTRAAVIPNGIDLPGEEEAGRRGGSRPTVLFLGMMAYSANIDVVVYFVQNIWPKILKDLPSARFLVVGRDPGLRVQRLHDGNRNIVTGTVGSISPYFREATAMVVRLRFGSGTRIKILESWAHRLPVVTTRLGADGLEAENGKHLLIADSAEDFTRACLRLVQDRCLRGHLAGEGYAHVRERYTWESVEGKVREIARASETRTGRQPPQVVATRVFGDSA